MLEILIGLVVCLVFLCCFLLVVVLVKAIRVWYTKVVDQVFYKLLDVLFGGV